MSMQTLTILQFICVLAAYLGMTVLLPAFVFYRKVSGERFCVRFMIYLVIGNVYLMNMVMVLQLLHISNWFTLVLGTVLPVLWTMLRVHNVTIKDGVLGVARSVNSFLTGTMGGRLLLNKMLRFIGKCLKTGFLRLLRSIWKNFFDWVFTVGCIAAILWLYGSNLIWNMGYCASDVPVHNYWINALSRNNIFVAGVYPHGFHCMIYYLHEVFGFYTFVLLRVFCLVQNLVIHLVMLAFLKACFRNRYTPYLAMIMYVFVNIWNEDTYKRYYSTIPQEFGMIFILPAIFFLFAFFEARGHEDGTKKWKVHSTLYLVLFSLSFSATIAVHFYNAMVAGLFCIGVGIGFSGLIFRKAYFGRIMLAGILGVLLAALPMGVAAAMGTPLQGSLGWGMNIIKGSSDSGEVSVQGQPQTTAAASGQQGSPGSQVPGSGVSGPGMTGGEITAAEGAVLPPEPRPTLGGRLNQLTARVADKWKKLIDLAKWFVSLIQIYVLAYASYDTVALILSSAIFTGIIGCIFLLSRKSRHYGCILLSVAFGMMFLYVAMMAKRLGIPEIMDQGRCSIYLAYMLSALMAFTADAVISLITSHVMKQSLANMATLLGIILIIGVLVIGDLYKKPLNITALESNDAITCLTNILQDNQHFQFTVCSANDELRMVEDYGYHYEIITLLQSMEGTRQDEYLTIPTSKVYFFIEKIPINYTVVYEGSGRKVSEVGAYRPLPYGGGLSVYKGANRYTVMSKMYYWALAFKKMYPNEMRVYYETDAFICYEVEQNTYRLFDFSIDYGYNTYDMTSE